LNPASRVNEKYFPSDALAVQDATGARGGASELIGMQKRLIDANILKSPSVLSIMNDRSHLRHGKINLHGNGLGVPSPEMVERRAREIAMIDERNPHEFTESDWNQAKNELTGVEGSHAPEVDDTVEDEMSERDDIPGASGHQVPNNGFDEDENVGEELVSGGIEEAAHDQMVEARREELDQEREQ
jgi:hypothetical protein